MLSRASVLSGQSQYKALLAIASRATATSPANNAPPATECSAAAGNRLVRAEPGKVRLGFLPDEWFTFFYKKTGVTGPYTLGVTLSTYLISKEIYVMEHEYYSGLSLLILAVLAVKKMGPPLAKYLDKEIDAYEADWNEGRENQKSNLAAQIKNEEKMQWSADGQTMLVDAKRENVALQLEANYRERLMTAYTAVKQRLDYQVELQNVDRRIKQKNLVDWVVRHVRGSVTADQDKQNIDKCIADLGLLSAKAR